MRARHTILTGLIALLTFVLADGAFAQRMTGHGPSSSMGNMRPTGPANGGGDYRGGGLRGPGWGVAVPGVILSAPQGYPPNGPFIDDGPRSSNTNRRGASGA